MFWETESSQAPVQKPVTLIANLRWDFAPGVELNDDREIIHLNDFFVNSLAL
jgi:hypothetical protein